MKIRSLIYSCFMFGALFFTSCEKYIDRNPLSEISIDQGYTDSSTFENAINGVYSQFYSLAPEFVTLTELRSDNFTHYQWIQEAYSNNKFGTYDTDPLWDGLYTMVSRASEIIERISDIEFTGKDIIDAEARFFRAYAFFWLVRSFGPVPIPPKASLSLEESLEIPRSSLQEVYKHIEDDLKFSINNLDKNRTFGKVNKYIAKAMLAKVYVFESGYPVENERYEDAIPLLEDIIKSGKYELENSYSDIFSKTGEKGKEIIWSAIMDSDSKGHHHSGQYIIDPNEPDLVMACSPEFGSGQNALLGDLWLSFEENDQRRDVSLDSSSYDPTGAYRRQVNCAKYKYGYVSGIGWSSDYIFLRYANILLLYAECLDKTDHLSIIEDKWGILNKIRDRSGINDPVSHSDGFENALLLERRHEFVWEGVRWFDIVRTKTFVDKLEKVGHSDVADFWKYLPIPTSEMDKMNGFWENNDGY